MTSERPSPDVIGLLRELLRSELKHVHARLDQQGRELGQLRLENKSDHQELRRDFQGMRTDVSRALAEAEELREWRDGHNDHHGKNDTAIAERIDGIAGSKHDEAIADQAIADYRQRFAWIGNLGLDAMKAVALTGVGAGLLGIGWLLKVVFG